MTNPWCLPTLDPNTLPSTTNPPHYTPTAEALKRRKIAVFINESASRLNLPRLTIATSSVFMHRFFTLHSFADYPAFEVGVACLFLGSKVEETPRKINQVLGVCLSVRKEKDKGKGKGPTSTAVGSLPPPTLLSASSSSSSQSQSTDPTATPTATPVVDICDIPVDPKNANFIQLKEKVLLFERVLLHTMSFDLMVEHPYKYLVEVIKWLGNRGLKREEEQSSSSNSLLETQQQQHHQPPQQSGGSKGLSHEVTQCAVNLLNDTFQTRLCLKHQPLKIALTCITIAGSIKKIQPVRGSGGGAGAAASSSQGPGSSGGGGGGSDNIPLWIEVFDRVYNSSNIITVEEINDIQKELTNVYDGKMHEFYSASSSGGGGGVKRESSSASDDTSMSKKAKTL
jgi:hypothetical protein